MLSAYGTDRPDEANRMNYGHRIPLLSASGTGIAVGSSFDKNSQYGNYGTLQFVTDDPITLFIQLLRVVILAHGT